MKMLLSLFHLTSLDNRSGVSRGLLKIKLKNVIDTAMEYTNFVAIEVKL